MAGFMIAITVFVVCDTKIIRVFFKARTNTQTHSHTDDSFARLLKHTNTRPKISVEYLRKIFSDEQYMHIWIEKEKESVRMCGQRK